jgi:dihydroorotate dehydrogenase
MSFMLYSLLRPFIFKFDPEKMHHLMIGLGEGISKTPLKLLVKVLFNYQNKILEQNWQNIVFKNPVGLAAGYDKNGRLTQFADALGLGFLEVGSITAKPWAGNPKPRVFRLLKDRAIINRMGLGNDGVEVISQRLKNTKESILLGINIAKTPLEQNETEGINDYLQSYQKLYEIGAYHVLNLSCPNTHDGKTFEEPTAMKNLLMTIAAYRKTQSNFKPLLIKLSPDTPFEKIDQILQIAKEAKVDGYVISNTSKNRDGLKTSPERLIQIGNGGLSGDPVDERSNVLIRYVYKKAGAPFIIGVGGISNVQSALAKIKAGAALVQVYTGLIYEGPGLVKRINRGLVIELKKAGFKQLKDAIGVAS